MKQNDVRMLPVLREGRLVGVVTDRDLKRASASEATTLEVHELFYLISCIKVSSIMSSPAISVPPDLTVEEAAEVLLKHRIPWNSFNRKTGSWALSASPKSTSCSSL